MLTKCFQQRWTDSDLLDKCKCMEVLREIWLQPHFRALKELSQQLQVHLPQDLLPLLVSYYSRWYDRCGSPPHVESSMWTTLHHAKIFMNRDLCCMVNRDDLIIDLIAESFCVPASCSYDLIVQSSRGEPIFFLRNPCYGDSWERRHIYEYLSGKHSWVCPTRVAWSPQSITIQDDMLFVWIANSVRRYKLVKSGRGRLLFYKHGSINLLSQERLSHKHVDLYHRSVLVLPSKKVLALAWERTGKPHFTRRFVLRLLDSKNRSLIDEREVSRESSELVIVDMEKEIFAVSTSQSTILMQAKKGFPFLRTISHHPWLSEQPLLFGMYGNPFFYDMTMFKPNTVSNTVDLYPVVLRRNTCTTEKKSVSFKECDEDGDDQDIDQDIEKGDEEDVSLCSTCESTQSSCFESCVLCGGVVQ